MKLKILETKLFKKLKKGLLKYSIIKDNDLDYVKTSFSTNLFNDPTIRPHKIKCGKDELISLSIPNTQYRILCYLTCTPKIAVFVWIGTHRDYEIVIKNTKNCKKYIFDCEDLDNLL